MPFIAMFSIPASAIFGVLGSLVLALRSRGLLRTAGGPNTGLHEFARFARWHTRICLLLAAIAGVILFYYANSMVYGDKWRYALVTAIFAIGPLAAWLLSSLALVHLIARRGAKWTNLLIAAAIHVLLLAAGIPLLLLASALTGAPM